MSNDPKHVLTVGHLYPPGWDGNPRIPRGVGFVWTGEKRPPRAGEWYLSGAVIEAWFTPNDLSTPCHIAKMATDQPTGESTNRRLDQLSRAWNEFVFSRAGLPPGAGMQVVPEQHAYEALRDAMLALTGAALDDMVASELSEAPAASSVAHCGTQVDVRTQAGYAALRALLGFVDVDEMADRIGPLANEGVTTDGAHHKQWFLERIADLVGVKLDEHEPGIAP
jgi:hypothetical protein